MSFFKRFYCLIIFLPFLIVSCSNLLDGKEKKYNGEFGKVTCNIYLPQENPSARTAFPSISLSDASLSYEVSVFKKDGSVLSGAIVTSISNTKAFEISGIPLNVDFKLEVTVKDNSDKIIMKGSSNTLKLTPEVPVVSESITVSFLQTSTGKGSVKLPFATTVSSITNIYYSIDGESEVQNSSNSYLYIDEISAGSHLITFSFYNIDGTLLYQITEAINVYDNVETNKWENSGNNPWLQDVGGVLKLKITPDVIKEYELKTLYVDQTNNDSTETGTYYNPYKSLQKAVDKIVKYGNDSDEYTISLLSDVVATDNNMTLVTTNEKTLVSINTIDSKKNITITSVNGIKTLDADNKGRVIYIAGNENTIVNLKNIIVKNGYLLASSDVQRNGGGIYNACNLELNNAQVLSCKLESPNASASGNVYGGGIYNDSEGNLTINSAVISDCSCEASVKDKQAYGGGIYNIGTCTINSVIVTGCTVQGNINSSSDNSPKGAGIYNNYTLVLGNAKSESSEPDVIIGIGTYNEEQYKKPNKCTKGKGGGVYNNREITINSDCVIGAYNPGKCASVPTEENPDNCGNYCTGTAGAGLYSNMNSTCTINGGYISYNCGNNAFTSGNFQGVGMALHDTGVTCSFKNLEVSYNYSACKGNGIGFYSPNCAIENIKVFGNEGSSSYDDYKGIGAFLYNGCSLKGETWFDETNNVYLYGGEITISGDLTPKNSSGVIKTVVANVTKATVTNDTEFLSAETPQLISDNVSKFKITNDGGWELIQSSSEPKKGIAKQVLYVAGTGSTVLTAGSTKNGTKEHPFNDITSAINQILNDGTLIYIDGEFTLAEGITVSKACTIEKYSGAITAKLKYIGTDSCIKTTKSINFNSIIIDGTSDNASRAIETTGNAITVTLNDTQIQNFNGVDYGAGIKLTAANSHVLLKGNSSITGCSATYSGAGIYQNANTCKIQLQDSVYLDENSIIRLASGGTVMITGELTPPATNKIVANIRPDSYIDGTRIISAANDELIQNNHAKFSISSNGDYFYIIKNDGKLVKVDNYSSDMVIVRSADDLVTGRVNLLINDIHMGAKNFRGTIIAPTGLEVTIYADVSSRLFSSINLGSSDGGRIIIDGSYATSSGSGSPGIFYGGYSYTVTNVTVQNFNAYYSIFEVKNGTNSNVTCNIEDVIIKDCPKSTGIYGYVYAGYDATINLKNVTITKCYKGIDLNSSRDTSQIDLYVDSNTSINNNERNFVYFETQNKNGIINYYVNGEKTNFPS